MDDANEGFLLIGTATIILTSFLVTVIAVMLIYRKRKLQHVKEVDTMNEKFSAELLQTQIEVQEQTMQYIGREIHDNVGQKLTLAAIYAQQLDMEFTNEKAQKKIIAVASIIQESLSDLRSLSKNLTDTKQLHTNLCTLISNECARVQATGSCTVSVNSNSKDIEVSQAIGNFVLRILQEFMQNSLKHSHCTAITIQLHKTQEGLLIDVGDNGIGFEITKETIRKGIGLQNMKKRAEIIGAVFKMESAEGGTKMHLFIPANKYNS